MTCAETGYDTGSMGDLGQPLCVCSSHHRKLCQQYRLCGTLEVCVHACVCELRFFFFSNDSYVCLFICIYGKMPLHLYLHVRTHSYTSICTHIRALSDKHTLILIQAQRLNDIDIVQCFWSGLRGTAMLFLGKPGVGPFPLSGIDG